MARRLFIFAAYDKDAIIDDSVLVYVRALSEIGDIVFYMDSDAADSELAKVRKLVLYAGASRHNEYDFGSYKRGFEWAKNNIDLNYYDWIYFVNDSMYAPLNPISPILEDLESRGTDAAGIVRYPGKREHIQAWFFGASKKLFLSQNFLNFITGIKFAGGKSGVISKYEHGFTRMLKSGGYSFCIKRTLHGRGVYNRIKWLFRHGFPFMKKLSITRKRGYLGSQILYIIEHANPEIRDAIMQNANRVYGADYMKWLLTKNPLRILARGLRHFLLKIFKEGI
ncbi:MAG: hypothetical protein LBF28_00535 [Rickettsiales bacterium]|jgi:lipopolysaccharide biosynthesis protein|nr:hypothetical protein [Rickettsiales bacterium]